MEQHIKYKQQNEQHMNETNMEIIIINKNQRKTHVNTKNNDKYTNVGNKT